MAFESPGRRSAAPAAAFAGKAGKRFVCDCVRTGRTTQPLHLAAMPVRCQPRGRAGTHRHGVVEEGRTDPRLFPCRNQGRPTLLALPRRTVPPDRRAPLVSARHLCMTLRDAISPFRVILSLSKDEGEIAPQDYSA